MHLVLDFDGTITAEDTIGELASAAIAFQQRRGGRDVQAAWEAAVRDYAADCAAYQAAYQAAGRRTDGARVGSAPSRGPRQREERLLAGLAGVEEASLRRVARAGIFAACDAACLFGMGADAVAQGRVVVRRGLGALLGLASRRGWRTGVVSVNWSRAFVRGVLHPLGMGHGDNDAIVANEISPVDGRVRGPAGPPMITSRDKLQALRRLVGDGRGRRVVYFGDSATDLECLLYDAGVVMAPAAGPSSALQTLRRCGLDVPHIAARQLQVGEATVCWAGDFQDVLDSGLLDELARDPMAQTRTCEPPGRVDQNQESAQDAVRP